MPNFTPVDYDPFAGAAEAAPNLFPADGPLSGTAGAPNPVPYNPFAGASAPRLIPVDHDPFADNPAAAPRLIPVDYDPFGGAAAPNLIPVDHDPFADNPSAAPKLIPVDYDPFAAPAFDAQSRYNLETNVDNSAISNPLPASPPAQAFASNRSPSNSSPPSEVNLYATDSRPSSLAVRTRFSPGNVPIINTSRPLGPAQSETAVQRLAGRLVDPGSGQSNENSTPEDGSRGSNSSPGELPFGLGGQTSVTRVLRDSNGNITAIIQVRPADESSSGTTDESGLDFPRATQAAYVNLAIQPNQAINRATDRLLQVLEDIVGEMGSGFGSLFGIRVHTEFAKRVRALDLPGIGETGVEQTFHPGIIFDPNELLNYGLKDSVRTDVILKDTKDPTIPIIILRYKTIDAIPR